MFRFLVTLTAGVVLGFILATLREGVADQSRLRDAREDAIRLRSQLASAQQAAAAAKIAKASVPPPTAAPASQDDLTRIRGIGKVFQARLQAAGINSFAQLAAASPDQIRSAVAAEDWQKIDPEEWRAEAARFSKPQSKTG